MRILTMLIGVCLAAGQAWAANCDGSIEVKQKLSDAKTSDNFVVQSFGADCMDAKVLIYMDAAGSGMHPLFIGKLEDFTGSGSGVTPATLPDALKEIASRIEPGQKAQLETWAQLKRAGTQPGGAPWRGTPLVRAEYERVLKLKPRTLIVPTDAARGKLIAWDPSGLSGRPVELVFFGD